MSVIKIPLDFEAWENIARERFRAAPAENAGEVFHDREGRQRIENAVIALVTDHFDHGVDDYGAYAREIVQAVEDAWIDIEYREVSQ